MTHLRRTLLKQHPSLWVLPIFLAATIAAIWRFLPWTTSVLFGDDLSLYLPFLDGSCATRASQMLVATCGDRFRPVASGFIVALMHAFGPQKSLFIDVNFALQGAIATMAFLVAFHLSRRSWLTALGIAGAVALSRFAVWNVNEVIGPVESLPLLLTLGAVYSVIRAEQSQERVGRWGMLAMLCAFLALFAHERFTVVPVWLALAFLSSKQVRQLPVWRIALLVGGCVAMPVFYIVYKKFGLDSYFLIGTGNTHLKLDFPLIAQHAYQGVSSIFGFNHGPSYLLGKNVVPGWNLPFLFASGFLLLFLTIALYTLRRVLAATPSFRAKIESLRWPVLLLILAAVLLIPALLTIHVEIRWLYASFIMVLLACACAVSVASHDARRRIAIVVVVLCATSVALDTTIMRSFNDLFFIASGQYADLVKRDIIDKHPEQKSDIALLAAQEHCTFTLLGGGFFRVYGNGPRKVYCFSSLAAASQAKLPTGTPFYIKKDNQLVDVTNAVSQMVVQASEESTSFSFIDNFPSGHINDTSQVATPTGKGALVLPWQTDTGGISSLTVISGFSYGYDKVPVPPDAQLRFAVGQVYPSSQSARAVVRIDRGAGDPLVVYSHDLDPPKLGKDIPFEVVSIPLATYAGEAISVSFSVESPGGNPNGHWVAFANPRIVTVSESEHAAPTPGDMQAPSALTIEATSSPAISVNPAILDSCNGTVTNVKWNAEKIGAITTSTEVWVGTSDDDLKLFSAGGAVGEAKTGSWTTPGTHFLLKNKQNGKVLGEIVVGGPACP